MSDWLYAPRRHLRVKAIDLDGAALQVSEAIEVAKARLRFKAPKTKRGRRAVALPASTVEALWQHKADQPRERLVLPPNS